MPNSSTMPCPRLSDTLHVRTLLAPRNWKICLTLSLRCSPSCGWTLERAFQATINARRLSPPTNEEGKMKNRTQKLVLISWSKNMGQSCQTSVTNPCCAGFRSPPGMNSISDTATNMRWPTTHCNCNSALQCMVAMWRRANLSSPDTQMSPVSYTADPWRTGMHFISTSLAQRMVNCCVHSYTCTWW